MHKMKSTYLKFILVFFFSIYQHDIFAQALPIQYDAKVNTEHKKILENIFEDLSFRLPEKFKKGLPLKISIKVNSDLKETLSSSQFCMGNKNSDNQKSSFNHTSFVLYHRLQNKLVINQLLLNELSKGQQQTDKMNCSHKSFYEQGLAYIIHELGHAYDHKQGGISKSNEFVKVAGFKKSLLGLVIKNKNHSSDRSARSDMNEYENVSEAFAVNLEYYALDPEYACRRPTLFRFYQKLFGYDPFSKRSCKMNDQVMISSAQGIYPAELNSDRIYRVDYLLASPGKELSSGFGHSMLRLVVCAPKHIDPISQKIVAATPIGPKCLDDKSFHLVVSYRANVENATSNYLKGVFGGYPSKLYMMNFSEVVDEYGRDELRDLYVYPLNLSENEKKSFIEKVIEEHWNYRGSYKFFTNNCATESLDLLKMTLTRDGLNKNVSITPNGLLKDLKKLGIINENMNENLIEVYKSIGSEINDSLRLAYTLNVPKKTIDKNDSSSFFRFIEESNAQGRMKKFMAVQNSPIPSIDAHGIVFEMKKRLMQYASFSIIEQQILRAKKLGIRKKSADIYLNSTDEDFKKKIDRLTYFLQQSINGHIQKGYGIPLESEIIFNPKERENLETSDQLMSDIENYLEQVFPEEFREQSAIQDNLLKMNQVTIKFRKNYRSELIKYVRAVIKNMSYSDSGLLILGGVKSNDPKAFLSLRKALDPQLVTFEEMLDSQLQKYVNEVIL